MSGQVIARWTSRIVLLVLVVAAVVLLHGTAKQYERRLKSQRGETSAPRSSDSSATLKRLHARAHAMAERRAREVAAEKAAGASAAKAAEASAAKPPASSLTASGAQVEETPATLGSTLRVPVRP